MSAGRRWLWFILVVSLLLFISLEAAAADDGKGGGNDDNGKPGGVVRGGDDGNKGGKDDDDGGKKGDDDGKNGGKKGDDDDKKGGKDDDDKKGGKGDDDKNGGKGDDDKKGGKDDDDNGKKGDKNKPAPPTPSPSTPTPSTPSVPSIPTPSTPSVPSIPTPSTPSVPSIPTPSTPSVPSIPTPSTPSVPSIPTPSTPSVPSIPTPSTPSKDESTDYYEVAPVQRTGQERAVCTARSSSCFLKPLTCPAECPTRKPKDNNIKGCFIDCSSKCETSCKWRRPQCDSFGSLCYDPRFVGGDGMMFYFHGSKGSDFAIVSDDNIQINAHFIGTRPAGRTRDFTWVQALSIMFDTHTLILAAQKVSKWDDKVDHLIVKWDNEMINIPTDGQAEWRIDAGNNVVVVERTDDFDTIRATISGLVQVDVRVTPIGEKENKVHNYQIPSDDAFAHLETQFKFFKLSNFVEGVLGKTYQPGYESPVKMGVAMPSMGGEQNYQTPSLDSPICKLCRFQRPSISMVTAI